MDIVLANPRGFCAGVDRAIEIVNRALDLFGAPIYVRHEVVHNRFVVEDLRSRGAIFVEELDEIPDGATVIFSAHGVSQAVRSEADARGLKVFDATCPLVTKVHMEVVRHCRAGRDVVLIGHAGHPEVEGTMGQWLREGAVGAIHLVEDVNDVAHMQVGQPDNLAYTKVRIDGRALDTVRPISVKAGILPRTHGSALFTRGETQAIVVTTLGTARDGQIIDAVSGEYKEHFLFHYNFPPFSVGECGRFGAPKRREIGHGRLAKRGVLAVMPSMEEFPYTIRVVSEITESNGSSSMASVCGSSLALMDAGVPVKAPVAGIAMGLVKEGERFVVLSDILGDEDHLGDMDFKVAGSAAGISALQMDIKIEGITEEIMKIALAQAKEGRLHILGEMAKGLSAPRAELSDFAPRLLTMRIHPDKIREVIGKGGSVIQAITKETGTQIDIQDDGTIVIASVNAAAAQAAKSRIESITSDVEPGRVYEGKVAKLMDFGAFVTIAPGKDGLVHVSQISNERVEKVSDKLKEGDIVKVKVLEVDKQGRIRLSIKAVLEDEAG